MPNTIGTTPGSGRTLRTMKVGTGGEAAQLVAVITAPYQSLGTATFTVGAAALTLGDSATTPLNVAIPTGATHAIISVKATPGASDTDLDPDGIRVRDDNTAPTTSVGLFLPGGSAMEVAPITVAGAIPTAEDTPALGRVKLIRAQATSMEVTVSYRSYAAA